MYLFTYFQAVDKYGTQIGSSMALGVPYVSFYRDLKMIILPVIMKKQ